MSHFAKVLNGVVDQVIVADQGFIDSGAAGNPADWIQTSYGTKGGVHYGANGEPDGGIALRANFATVGGVYDADADVFYAPKPFASWSIGSPDWQWVPPAQYPDDGRFYRWDEPSMSWVPVVDGQASPHA